MLQKLNEEIHHIIFSSTKPYYALNTFYIIFYENIPLPIISTLSPTRRATKHYHLSIY